MRAGIVEPFDALRAAATAPASAAHLLSRLKAKAERTTLRALRSGRRLDRLVTD